jgi:hypothetical protein
MDLSFMRQRGQALLMLTVSLLTLVGMLGLSVDLGWMYFMKKSAQAAADAAAVAGAQAAFKSGGATPSCGTQVVCQSATACPTSIGSPPSSNAGNACLYAQANGFTTGGHSGRQSVTVEANTTSPPPAAPGVQSMHYWVTVHVAESVPQLFSAILGNSTGTVSAQATAGVRSGANGGCIYVMSPTGTAVTNSGGALLQSSCGVYVNSNSSAAVLLSGTTRINATDGASVNIVGGWLKSGSATITPAPNLGATPQTDPFASLAPPTVGACTSGGVTLSGSDTRTLNPGVYCGAITMSGSSSLTFNPGLYVLKGGINMSGPTSISGTGVTLFNLTGGITLSGTAGINLTAPATGAYAGIVIFQDRGNTSGMTLSGGSTQTVTGVVYTLHGPLTYSGGSGTNAVSTTIVVNVLTFSGNSYIKDSSATGGGLGGGNVMLIG